ncbi:hypothetical protein B0H14DRAFT_3520647 [Mycena olivaceomarginata]|nr:hypothetical protein B0H14DRAFT_3520647 [Mycena olivaceomarginata]
MYQEACAIWKLMCERYHDHGDDDEPPSPVESPPPSPTPGPARRRHSRHGSLPPPAKPASPLAKLSPAPAHTRAAPPPVSVSTAQVTRASPAPARARAAPPVSVSTAQVTRAPPQPRISVVLSKRHPGEWTMGDTLWGIEGVLLLLEDRYDVVDYIHTNRLPSACLLQSRERQVLDAFVTSRTYGIEDMNN